MKKLLLILFVFLFSVSGCAGSDAILITVTENGIESDTSEVVINNFYPGAKAEITYRIHNKTNGTLTPEIYFVDYAEISDYSKSYGAVKAPAEITEWLKFPKMNELKAGAIKDYTVTIEMPKGTYNIPDKIGFQVQVSGNNGGVVQTAVGQWWLVNMR